MPENNRARSAVYLLGVTQHQVTSIDTLDPEALTDTQDGSYDPPAPGAARPQANCGSWIRQLQERSVRR